MYHHIPAHLVIPGDVAIITARPAVVTRVVLDAVTPGFPDRTVHIYAADAPSDPVVMRPTDVVAVTQPEPEPSIIYIGARVTYHGSLRSQHGRAFLVFPCTWFGGRCAGCDDDREADAPTRYTLHDPQTGDAIHHVRPTSITPHPHRWPSDAMPMRIGPYTYMASHATPGGSQYSRTVHFHTADGLGRTWARVNPNDDTIRQLDRQGRGLAA